MDEYKKKTANNINEIFNQKRCCFLLCLTAFIFFTAQTLYSKDIDWVFVESKNGIALFKSKEKIDGLIPFKVKTILNIPYDKIVKVMVNAEKKSMWAPKLKKTKVHRQLAVNQFVYSEFYEVPFPFYDREFYLLGTVKFDRERIIFVAENPKTDHKPARRHVLVNVEKLEFKITPVGSNHTHIEFTFIGDMGGHVPNFVINIIQRRWPLKFIYALSDYIAKNENIECERYDSIMKEFRDIKSSDESIDG